MLSLSDNNQTDIIEAFNTFKGTVDSCLFLTVIRNATLCSLLQTV